MEGRGVNFRTEERNAGGGAVHAATLCGGMESVEEGV